MCWNKKEDSEENKYLFADNIEIRDGLYTTLLENYIKTQKSINRTQLFFKVIFFIMVCTVFVGVVFAGVICLLSIANKDNVSWEDVSVALTGFGSILGVVIVLPSKISDNLFPATASKEIIEIVNNMQQYDLKSYTEEPFEDDDDVQENENTQIDVSIDSIDLSTNKKNILAWLKEKIITLNKK